MIDNLVLLFHGALYTHCNHHYDLGLFTPKILTLHSCPTIENKYMAIIPPLISYVGYLIIATSPILSIQIVYVHILEVKSAPYSMREGVILNSPFSLHDFFRISCRKV